MLRGATISIKQHVQVFPHKIVRIYNKFVRGTDKLDIIVQYTSPHYHLEDGRYLSLHSVVIAIVNAWFLFRRNTKWLDPKAKLVSLQNFQACVASSSVETHKIKRGRPSIEPTLILIPTKLVNSFHATDLFWYLLKTSENLWFSHVFRGYQKISVAQNELKYSPVDSNWRREERWHWSFSWLERKVRALPSMSSWLYILM